MKQNKYFRFMRLCLLLAGMACQWLTVAAQEETPGSEVLMAYPTTLQLAVKNNLLYDATTTPNLGVEVGLGKRSTAQVFYGLNPWKGSDKAFKHWLVQPEYRYWFCQAFDGWFVGAHLMGGEFNVSNVEMPLGLLPDFKKDKREEGWFLGGGVTAGYQWMLSRHWNAEASLGIGYDYIKYDRYKCGHCGELEKSGHANYFGPTKAALSVLYIF